MMKHTMDTEVTILRKRNTLPPKGEKAVNEARRKGTDIETQRKMFAGTNKQHQALKSSAKLDQEEPEKLGHNKVSFDVGKLIQQRRMAKGLSQEDLAKLINEPRKIITDYEAGSGIIRHDILTKIERELGIKLRGKDIGKLIEKKPPTKKKG